MGAESVYGAEYAGSVVSSSQSSRKRARSDRGGKDHAEAHNDDIWDRRSSFEYGIFGVLFTLSKEKSETHIRIRWILLKIFLDAWQLFTTVISPEAQGWSINANGTAWKIINVLNFTWLGDLGYTAYLAVLYSMLTLLAVNVAMCIWVAWCFKEHKFPVVWPIKVLRVFSSVFFQAFDVASLNLLQLGIRCRFTGPVKPHLHFDLFPEYSCAAPPHIMHAIVSALCLVLFVVIALLLNMAEVEVNPLSRRPNSLGHSGAEVMAFAIKVLLTLVDVFLGWRTVAACAYLLLSLALAWQSLRWSPHLVAWVNYLKVGVAVSICWCCVTLMLLVFRPGVKADQRGAFADAMTITMLSGLAPAFVAGMAMSWGMLRHMDKCAQQALLNPDGLSTREAFHSFDEPRDIEMVARCCRALKKPYKPHPEAVDRAHKLIKAGLEIFPGSAYMLLLHANFMIDVLGITQSGGRRIEEARKLNPGLMCRFIMFIRQQQATQHAAGNSVDSSGSMDLLGYVEYQRKQRMVVRLHREALQAMCNFWRALDAEKVSFRTLSKALSKIESSVSQAQQAYHVVLERYGNNPKLVHLYGRFLQSIKNDPWRAAEYFAEAERLEELQDGNEGGPVMPDGTPLARMDEMDSAVLLVNASGVIQMANRVTHSLFGYKRGALEGKPLSTLLAPQFNKWLAGKLATLVALSTPLLLVDGSAEEAADDHPADEVVVGLHFERLAFPVKLCLRKASGVGEDSTLIAMIELVSSPKDEATLWVAPNGIITACDPQFVAMFGWKAADVNGANVSALISSSQDGQPPSSRQGSLVRVSSVRSSLAVPTRSNDASVPVMRRLLAGAKAAAAGPSDASRELRSQVYHKYRRSPIETAVSLAENDPSLADVRVFQLRIKLVGEQQHLLVVGRKGHILHASSEVVGWLKDVVGAPGGRTPLAGKLRGGLLRAGGVGDEAGGEGGGGGVTTAAELLAGYTFFDFLPAPWKDMHVKMLKDTTSLSPPPFNYWSCRMPVSGGPGPTLPLRSASGKEVLMRVTVETADMPGEMVHVIKLSRSSLTEGLSERRVRLHLNADGRVAAVEGRARQLFGMETYQIMGRGLWELVDEQIPASQANARGAGLPSDGARLVAALNTRVVSYRGHSWRVQVGLKPSAKGESGAYGKTIPTGRAPGPGTFGAAAVMQLHVESVAPGGTPGAGVVVDLWPVSSLSGVLQLEPSGRITGVLEEHLRPVGLLFGLPTRALVGCLLGELVALPPGRTRPGDLLSSQSLAKKSSLKPNSKDTAIKAGPILPLAGAHLDGQPLRLNLQIIGKPSCEEPVIAILRPHAPAMMPSLNAAGQPSPIIAVPPPPALLALQPPALPGPSPPAAGSPRGEAMLRLGGPPPPPPPPAANAPPVPLFTRASTPVPVPVANAPGSRPDSPGYLAAGVRAGGLPASWNSPMVTDEVQSLMCTISAPGAPRPGTTTHEPHPTPAGAGVVSTPPKPPAASLDVGGIPQPSVTAAGGGGGAAKAAAEQAGRNKLADMVKSVGASPSRASGSLRPSVEDRPSGASQSPLSLPPPPPPQQQPLQPRGSKEGAAGAPGAFSRPSEAPSLPGTPMAPPAGYSNKLDSAAGGAEGTVPFTSRADDDGGSVAGSSHGGGRKFKDDSVTQSAGLHVGGDRVREWVASKGAYYQNTVASGPAGGVGAAGGDKEEDDDTPHTPSSPPSSPEDDIFGGPEDPVGAGPGPYSRAVSGRSRRKTSTRRGDLGTAKDAAGAAGGAPAGHKGGSVHERSYHRHKTGEFDAGSVGEDDAGSDGQSTGSAGQAVVTGAEYNRGKRYKKLVKLMDSPQAQQAQRRLRLHTLITVAVLAIVHVTCFVLTVTSIESQRKSILRLGDSGKAQLFLNMVTTDVRSLDILSANKSLPNLYTVADIPYFVERISGTADQVKSIANDILNNNIKKGSSSTIVQIFYHDHRAVWDEQNQDGSDRYTNVTIWDFVTRFYTMAKKLEQNHQAYLADGIRVQDTDVGQFLLKSGPDLWIDMRKVLDELLVIAVDNARWIDMLQVAFLVVEGAGVSFVAACYLAYLLRMVAAQRYKLYGIFLMIPIGLTRALASQSTNLFMDDDEDGEGDDEDTGRAERPEPRAAIESAEEVRETSGGPAPKLKRRATLKLDSKGHGDGARKPPTGRPSNSGAGAGVMDFSVRNGGGNTSDKQRTLTGEMAVDGAGGRAWWSWAWWKLRFQRLFRRRSRGVVLPLPPSLLSNPAAFGPSPSMSSSSASKRTLRMDSRETYVMLLPFIIWSALVVIIYAFAVIKMNGVVEVVAVHSVVNFMSGRTFRTVFFCQELANVEDPTQLPRHREALQVMLKKVRDAWYTLQLGSDAKSAAGPDTEQFYLVKDGISHSSQRLENLFYGSGHCHRLSFNLPCVAPAHRFYYITHMGMDSMMQQFMISISAMAYNQSDQPEGLSDDHFDFVYNVGGRDLVDGVLQIASAHMDTILSLYNSILILHIILFLFFCVLFIGFLAFLLNPLLQRVTKERRRIAELMSQLPLELDVEKLVARALGASAANGSGAPNTASIGGMPQQQDRTFSADDTAYNGNSGAMDLDSTVDATSKWKAIIRNASSLAGKPPMGNGSVHRRVHSISDAGNSVRPK